MRQGIAFVPKLWTLPEQAGCTSEERKKPERCQRRMWINKHSLKGTVWLPRTRSSSCGLRAPCGPTLRCERCLLSFAATTASFPTFIWANSRPVCGQRFTAGPRIEMTIDRSGHNSAGRNPIRTAVEPPCLFISKSFTGTLLIDMLQRLTLYCI